MWHLDRGCKEVCSSEGILYVASCQKCYNEQVNKGIKAPKEEIYIGESSRTLLTRAGQHTNDYRRRAKQELTDKDNDDKISSFMYDHHEDKHNGETIDPKNDYKFRLLTSEKQPLDRQILEAVKIKRGLEIETLKDK